jgi:hypothetical protein
MTRNGKIARLPHEIREELNHRLERNVPGITLVEWLNSLPEVQEVLRDLFDGNPVIPQNLSQWRQGGFAEWQARNDLFERAREADYLAGDLEESIGLMADRASQLLAARFAIALAEWSLGPNASASSEEDHDPADQSSPPSVPSVPSVVSVPSSITALKPLIPFARAIAQLRRADRDHAREKREQYHFDRKLRFDEGLDALRARFRREDAEAAAARAAAATQASAPPSPPPAATPNPKAAKSRSHRITPLSSHNKKTRRPKNLPKKSSPAAVLAPSTPALPLPESDLKTNPPEAPATAAPASAAPTELDWQLRNRPLPGDPEPAWRTQLRVQKTIPPWESPEPPEPPKTPRTAILARAGS